MKRVVFLLLILQLCILAEVVAIKGTVFDGEGAPLSGVSVNLKSLGKSTSSDAEGYYEFLLGTAIVSDALQTVGNNSLITISNSVFTLPATVHGKACSVRLFNMQGRQVRALFSSSGYRGETISLTRDIADGFYILHLELGEKSVATQILYRQSSINGQFSLPLTSNAVRETNGSLSLRSDLSLATTGVDTLVFSKEGYYTKKIHIPSYTIDPYDIVLTKIGEQSSSSAQTLDINDSYFNLHGGISLHILSSTGGSVDNQEKIFDYATSWNKLDRALLWVLDIKTPGALQVTPSFGVSSVEAGSEIEVSMGGESQRIQTKATGGSTSFAPFGVLHFTVRDTGKQLLRFRLKSLSGSTAGNVKEVKLAGSAAEGMEVWRARWRPEAVHCSWSTSEGPLAEQRLWVMEVTPANHDCWTYCPITGGGGYYGSPWMEGEITGLNFSVWAYSDGGEIPPAEEMSQLIAVGRGLEFGEFHHEGHGVKPRGDHPWIGKKPKRQILARAFDFGPIMTTMYGYYFDEDRNEWELYAAARYKNSKQEVNIGAFVEVTGAAQSQRTAPSLRKVFFEGWFQDRAKLWHPVDQMRATGSKVDAYKEWGVEDNRFFLAMGGLEKRTTTIFDYTLDSRPELPEYLSSSLSEKLTSKQLPATFAHTGVSNISTTGAVIGVTVSELGSNSTAEIFYGTTDGVTYGLDMDTDYQYFWQQKKEISLNKGSNSIALQGLASATTYFYRLRLLNDEGTTWSFETDSFTTE